MTKPTSAPVSNADALLMRDVVRANSSLGRYVVQFTAADTGLTGPVSIAEEWALAEQVATLCQGIRARAGRRAALLGEDVATSQPLLAMLDALPGPPWQVNAASGDAITCSRSWNTYTETVWTVDGYTAAWERTPIHGGPGHIGSKVSLVGPVDEVIAAINQPANPADEP